jgi:MFS superfamily sulfate permease-like transporter
MTNFLLGLITGILIAILNVLAYQKKMQEKVEKIIKKSQMAEIVDMNEPLHDVST